MKQMQLKIKNPNNLPTIDYRKVDTLQGELKDLSDKNYAKLKSVLKKRGFEVPLFLWKNEDHFYLMDGHQRHRVMVNEDASDNGSYEVPYILIEAADQKEAKAKLLEITSQYGHITQEGLDHFIAEAELVEAEVYEAVAFDALPLIGQDIPGDEQEKQDKATPPEISLIFESVAEREACEAELSEIMLADKYNVKIKVR